MLKSLSFACALSAVTVATAQAEQLFGLAGSGINQQIVIFDSEDRAITSSAGVSGLVDNLGVESLLSIDVRPATGELYGLDNNSNLYTLDPMTGAASRIGDSPISITPTGTPSTRTIDFNPTVDRIRVLGDSPDRNNLRVNPDTGVAIQDGTLAFDTDDPNAGERPFVVAGAYTNSFAGATSTVLYDLEAGNDVLTTQSPANAGTLQTVGPLGQNLINTAQASFDISGATGDAFLVFTGIFNTGGNVLYSVDLGTGAATALGPITGVASGAVTDIAVAFPIPEPASLALLGGAGLLVLGRRRRA